MGDDLNKDWFWSDDAIEYLEEFETTLYKVIRKHAIKLVLEENKEVITKDDLRSFMRKVLDEMDTLI